VAPGETVYWGPEGGGAAPVNPADADWPAPTQAQLEALGAAPAAPPALPPAAPLVVGPPIPENTPTLAPAAPLAVGPPIPETTPTLSPAAPAAPPATDWGASPAFGGPAPSAATPPSAPAPGKPYQKINGFAALVDLSSSELWLSPCQGGLVKAEAETILLRKMSHRIPNLPYVAALRVFGYKQAWREIDYTALYYGPTAFARDDFEAAVGRLAPANAISPFSVGIRALNQELAAMSSPRAILMFSDFEVTSSNPGDPPGEARKLRDLYGAETRFYSFYSTKDKKARTLANNIAAAGGGIAYDMCAMLEDEAAFEAMMMEIFGPKEEPPCADADGDGVCDDKDVCPSTPPGAPVDARGCWIAAYSQFFDFDKSEVKSQFYPRLESAAQIIKDNPQIARVTIAGHADAKGSDAYNLELGRKRAEAVKALLVKYGAQPERLVVESFGKSAPIADNSTEEGRAQNRRVEFHVGDVPPEAR
jgi:outer membrane protein OmpA-like peptidoglycan-associated protein